MNLVKVVLLALFISSMQNVVARDNVCKGAAECFAQGAAIGFDAGFYSPRGGDEYPYKGC